jgi:hypothetical protein
LSENCISGCVFIQKTHYSAYYIQYSLLNHIFPATSIETASTHSCVTRSFFQLLNPYLYCKVFLNLL